MIAVVVGLQWGDEGKGKIVDVLSQNADWIIRFGGGANAGHTIVHDGKKYAFHLLPSGLLRPNAKVVLGPGMVMDIEQLVGEINLLESSNIEWKHRLFVSDRVHLVLPSYKKEDEKLEKKRRIKIGTTKRGIGIAYSKKALRTGIRIADIDNEELWETNNKKDKQFIRRYKDILHSLMVNYFVCLDNINSTNENILYEGAQGVLLDPDYGTYPFVTSGPTALNGVYGSGITHGKVDEVLGVLKIYPTRVGEGPFPSEYGANEHELLELVRKRGNEIGTTTGRLRRCGHLDLIATRYACKLSGVTALALTHFDVLDVLERIQVCVGYETKDGIIDYIPSGYSELSKVKPVLKTFEGWHTSTEHLTDWDALPQRALQFIKVIEDFVEVSVQIVAVGPDRLQTIVRKGKWQEWTEG